MPPRDGLVAFHGLYDRGRFMQIPQNMPASANSMILVKFVGPALAVVTLLAACEARMGQPAAPPESAPVPAPEAFATTKQIMLGITIPTSDVVWGVGAKAPEDDAGWEKVQANAAALAESATLLTIGSRLQDRGDWLTYCEALRQSARAAAAAAQAKDVDKVLEAGDQIYEACDSCHMKYMAARAGE